MNAFPPRTLRRPLALIAALLLLASACTMNSSLLPPSLPEHPLVTADHSESELISASHVFALALQTVTEGEWRRGPDGLEHRRLKLTVTVPNCFKGQVALPASGPVTVEVEQRRSSEFETSDFMGPWSHVSPAAGASFLVYCRTSQQELGALVNEPALIRLASGTTAGDAALALQGEATAAAVRRKADPAEALERARVAWLQLLWESRASAGGVAARYVWERVRDGVAPESAPPLAEVERILFDAETRPELRESLAYSLFTAQLAATGGEPWARETLRLFLRLLSGPAEETLRRALANRYLPDLLFGPDRPPLAPPTLGLPVETLTAAQAVALQAGSEPARRLAGWLTPR